MLRYPKLRHNKQLVLLKLVLFLLVPIVSFSQKETVSDSLVIQPKAIGSSEIASYGQSSRDLIIKINSLEENSEKLKSIRDRLIVNDSVIQENLVLLKDTLANFNIDKLERIENQVSYIKIESTPWEIQTQNWRNKTEKNKKDIAFHIETWELTLDSIKQEEKTVDWTLDVDGSKRLIFDRVLDEVSNNKTEIQAADVGFKAWDNELVKTENALAITTGGLKEVFSIISRKREQLIDNIWVPEYSPIWEMKSDEYDSISTDDFVKQIKTKWEATLRYLSDKSEFLYSLVFWFIIVFFTIVYLRKKSSYVKENKDHLEIHEKIVLKFPFIISYIIVLFGLVLFIEAPIHLTYFLLFVSLFPFSVLIWELNETKKVSRVVLFIVFSLLFISLTYLIEWTIVLRVSLLLINAMVLYLLYKLSKDKTRIELEKEYWLGTLKTLISIFIVVNSLSILANIFGSVQLSLILTRTTLGSLIAFAIIREGVLIVQTFIHMLLLGPFYKYSYILQEDSTLVTNRLNKLLRIIGFLTWIYLITDLLQIRESLFTSIVDFINKPLKVGELSISFGNVIAFYLIIQIAYWFSKFVRYILQKEIFPRTSISSGSASTFSLLTKYTITFIGFLFAMAGAGIELSKVALGVSALGIGIGFGLQNIINNFVSGIILAVERPFKIGDVVKVDDIEGEVIDIGLRASQIKKWNGSDVLVPNGSLISGKLTNWTLSEKSIRRLDIEIHLPIEADITAAIKSIKATTSKVKKVLKKPPVFVNHEGVKDGVVVLRVYAWIKNFADGMPVGTAIKIAVFETLQKEGFEITIPKLDIKVNTPLELPDTSIPKEKE